MDDMAILQLLPTVEQRRTYLGLLGLFSCQMADRYPDASSSNKTVQREQWERQAHECLRAGYREGGL